MMKKRTDKQVFPKGTNRKDSRVGTGPFDMADVPPIRTVGIHQIIGFHLRENFCETFCYKRIKRLPNRIVERMPKITSCQKDKPEVIPVIGCAKLRLETIIPPVIGMGNDVIFCVR